MAKPDVSQIRQPFSLAPTSYSVRVESIRLASDSRKGKFSGEATVVIASPDGEIALQRSFAGAPSLDEVARVVLRGLQAWAAEVARAATEAQSEI